MYQSVNKQKPKKSKNKPYLPNHVLYLDFFYLILSQKKRESVRLFKSNESHYQHGNSYY